MVKRCPAPLAAAIASPLARFLVLITGAILVGPRIIKEAKTDREPVRLNAATPKPTVALPTDKPKLKQKPKFEFSSKTPALYGLGAISDYDHLDFFIRALHRGLNLFEYCELSPTKARCENLKDSKKGREVKNGLYCPRGGESCILMETALPNGTLKRFIDDWLNHTMKRWEFCMSQASEFYCGNVYTNFSRSCKRGLISPKRAAKQPYMLTNYTVHVTVRNNTYPYEGKGNKNVTTRSNSPERPPQDKKTPDSKDAKFTYENMDYWQYNRKYWFMLVLLVLAFAGTIYELALVAWFCLTYFKAGTGFHKWTVFYQYVLISINYASAAMFAMVLTQDIPRDSVTIWLAVFSVAIFISTANSCFFVYWLIRKQRISTEGGNQEGTK
ncbi:Hypothetical protein NTJ_13805 [Nesidiocoris tenuis]|uniref:Uncharacterized protein n=1 Tax=Nesidiocoris tenuis TaxID=355587 RepID=A0ABN7B9Q1_9HEMI|nr:Hypothetical protein NTJ_13805 [Nesidiocoris tenuis]